jgi:hypothetical protein
MPRELPIPAAAVADENSLELVRVWAAMNEQHVALVTEVWTDPGAWGILLVDLARHAARAYQQTTGIGQEEALSRIREAFDAEWSTPATDTGSIVS